MDLLDLPDALVDQALNTTQRRVSPAETDAPGRPTSHRETEAWVSCGGGCADQLGAELLREGEAVLQIGKGLLRVLVDGLQPRAAV